MKKIMLTIMAIFIISSFAGCIGDSTPVDDEFTTVKIVDTIGREVAVPKEVNSIVCVGSGSLRLLTYLDAVDMISGVEYSETKPTGRPYSLANTKIYSSLPIIGQGGQ
ncbi:periplasmic binding protein [Methanococcus maripaludis X1]|uniref:Periplasmic binding protein n=1 Tax=Methanococcus maripaludis X1 TaxID=1053692 RepID=G0H3X8_METMI